jgi:hypothetical protein
MTGQCYFCAAREHHECHSTACTCCGERNLKHQRDADRLEAAIRLHMTSNSNERALSKSRRKENHQC